MTDELEPLDDRVLLEVALEDDKTAGGLILPDQSREQVSLLKVVAVGGGTYSEEGDLIPTTVKVGDLVLLPKNTGTPVKLGGKDYLLVSERLCHAVRVADVAV